MDELKPYAVFAETVAAGSMSAAARRLGMSPSAVSQTLRALERQAGVTLLHRSTRKLSLTEAGERCYPHCRRLLEAAGAAADSLAQARDAPTGELRVAAPVGFAAHVPIALAPVLAESPQLRLRLLVDDAMIDLIDARIDIAIRVGRLADSNWVARRLCDFEMILCAAPAYLERHGAPASPGELAGHQWLAFARETTEAPPLEQTAAGPAPERLPTLALDLQQGAAGGERQSVQVGVRIASNNQFALQQMCEQGLGLARLAHADVLPALARGALVRLLPQWRFTPMPVAAVTPRRDGEPAKVRVAVAALKRYFAALPGSVAA
jgi:DNA-binding transcriptional LysR family regulator